MGLATVSSNKEKTTIRFKVKGPKTGTFKKLCTYTYKTTKLTYSLTQGRNAPSLEAVMQQWEDDQPLAADGDHTRMRRGDDIVWTQAGMRKVCDLLEPDQGRRFTLSQIVEVLNDPICLPSYVLKCPKLTRSNVQALLKKLFPDTRDTQAAVNMLEEAKTWPGWEHLTTSATHSTEEDGTLRLERLTIVMPLGAYLISCFGDFLLVDCTFDLSIYEGRFSIIVSVVDSCGHAHPVSITDVPGHRSGTVSLYACQPALLHAPTPARTRTHTSHFHFAGHWLVAFDETWEMVVAALYEMDRKPLSALLMADNEQAIDEAWNKSKWMRIATRARCSRHTRWSMAERVMPGGQKFGPDRATEWYEHSYATCASSFRDGIGVTCQKWRDKGDVVGADYLAHLAGTSKAPLHKWDPVPCPFIAAAAGESVNQIFKSTERGVKRQRLTLVQIVRKVIKSAYRSYKLLRDGPAICKEKRAKAEAALLAQKGKICDGKYVLLLAGLQQLRWRAYEIFTKHVEIGAKHTPRVPHWEVWSRYMCISAPEVKYTHKIVRKNSIWSCRVKEDNTPCWENRIRGLMCSHMCSYAQKLIAGGGVFDVRLVGMCSIKRHRAPTHLPQAPVNLAEPRHFKPVRERSIVDFSGASKLLEECAARCGDEGIRALHQLMQLRLLGGQPGGRTHEIADAFMKSSKLPDGRKDREARDVTTDAQVRYGNHPKAKSKLQKRRIANRGDHLVFSSGIRAKRQAGRRQRRPDVMLTGKNVPVGDDQLTLEKAKARGYVHSEHMIKYLTPFTAGSEDDQFNALNQ